MPDTRVHFDPYSLLVGARARGCFTCRYFQGRYFCGYHVLCERPGGVPVVGTPQHGCAYWEREPGSDDE
ncbi:MAG TPA: hypothetical protein VEN28_09020 [Burkholderiaceae bacterium]|nr:hypothetical protein [Burkholderiaceae bacterium]